VNRVEAVPPRDGAGAHRPLAAAEEAARWRVVNKEAGWTRWKCAFGRSRRWSRLAWPT